jgi:hypothetical protein
MMTLEQHAATPAGSVTSAVDGSALDTGSLIAEVGATKHDVPPFAADTLELCGELADLLMQMREHPEAVALGFWMRPAALVRMRAHLEASLPDGQIAVPRGLAFHVTPANVDPMFVYSWVLSLIVGNANLVRLSSRSSTLRGRLLEVVTAVLDQPGRERHALRNRFILTDHDPSTLAELSAASDLRVIWGGDATVEHIRRLPIPVRGRDIAFPDRHSMAILDASSVAALDDPELTSVADRFFDDAFWFDQGGCSSPRLLLWRAADRREVTTQAIERFRAAVVAATRRRRYEVETGMALNKMTFATEIAGRVEGVRIDATVNEATWVRLQGVAGYDRANCGGGLFFEVISDDLEADLLGLVGPRDQTVTTFGLDEDMLATLARRLNGRGIDRFVPLGRALTFDATWDGSDLLTEFSRRVVIDAGRRPRRSTEPVP